MGIWWIEYFSLIYQLHVPSQEERRIVFVSWKCLVLEQSDFGNGDDHDGSISVFLIIHSSIHSLISDNTQTRYLSSTISSHSLHRIVHHSSGYSYRDIHNLARLVTIRSLSLQTSREGVVNQDKHRLDEEEVQELLNSFTPSALLGLDVRSI